MFKQITLNNKEINKFFTRHPKAYVFFDREEDGVVYLHTEFSNPDRSKYVIFSKSHKVTNTIFERLVSFYGIKEVRRIGRSMNEQIPDILENYLSLKAHMAIETEKQNISGYVDTDIRRNLFLYKKTKDMKFFEKIKYANLLIPVKIINNQLEPLIVEQDFEVSKKTESGDIEKLLFTKPFLVAFTDTYSFNCCKNNANTNLYKDLQECKVILMNFKEIKKSLIKKNLFGLYINKNDVSIFEKNTDFILQTRFL